MNEFDVHRLLRGKIRVVASTDVTRENLPLLYTPGVGSVALECAKDPTKTFVYTRRSKLLAVVSDGSAVLGLGNLGPYGALPVMEGKAMLFKVFGDLDAVPICLATQDPEEIVKVVACLEPTFGGINLEDIAAPRCFEILKRIDESVSIPVFHDDQQGTAVAVVAGLLNALRVVGKRIEVVKIVVNGVGAAGYNVIKLLLRFGAKNIFPCDVCGIINSENALHEYHVEIARITGTLHTSGSLSDALVDADVFVGLSKGNILSAEDLRKMNHGAVVFALANPVPEVHPGLAKECGAAVVATGRSDFPNQINNLLVFPSVMRFAMEYQRKVTEELLIRATEVLASLVQPKADRVLPEATERYVHEELYKGLVSYLHGSER